MLGSLQIMQQGEPVGLASPAQRVLLAALLVRPGAVVSADRLMDALWGDDPPSTALESLRTHVYRLRRALSADGVLLTRPPGYVLAVEPEAVDAARFERLVAQAREQGSGRPQAAAGGLEEALGLWRGPAFAEFADEPFARPQARRLEELRLAAREDLLECKLTLGRHGEVAAEAESLVAEQPLRERAYEQLVIGLYRCGQQSRALEAYQRLREHLDTELGLEPSARLQQLEAAVLRHSPDLDWTPPPEEPVAVATEPHADTAVGGGRFTAGGPPVGWLPSELTSFVGRVTDVTDVLAALDQHRLVCLIGVGGVGKSRLALRVGREAADRYPNGVWWCDLASVTSPGAVVDVLAASLGVHQRSDDVQAAVIEALASAQAMLVVDNCEHVVDEASRILSVLVQCCPHVAVLATSRVALGVGLGQTRTVEPLPVPSADEDGGGEGSPAVQLFLDRARAVRPDLAPGPADWQRVAEVCRRLDGLPLAIELAAARMRSLNVVDVVERLNDRFRLLSAGPRATCARQQTLRAVVDWSFELLSETEQRLFERLSVFAGAFAPAAAERVCAGYPIEADETVDLLTGLVDASMVTVGPSQGEVTYRLLETMRAYGRARLAESGDLSLFEEAHARHYVDVAEAAGRGVRGPDEATWVARLDRDFPNLRQAHRWTLSNVEIDLALRLSAGLFRYALLRLRDEALRWAEASMQLPGAQAHPRWPVVCAAAGWGCGLRGQRDRAWELAAHGLARVEPGDPGHLPLLEVKAHIELWEGRLDDCIATMDHAAGLSADPYELFPWTVRSLALAYADQTDEAIAMAQHAQSDADRLANPTMMALSRYSLGEALLECDADAAAAVFDRAIELAGAVHNRMVLGVAGVSVMSLRARHGDPAEALRSSASVLELWAQTSDWTHFGVGLRSIAELFARVDADEAAAVLLGAVLDGEVGPPVYGADSERLAGIAGRLEQRLGTSAIAAARRRGQHMTAAEALGFTQAEIERIQTPENPEA